MGLILHLQSKSTDFTVLIRVILAPLNSDIPSLKAVFWVLWLLLNDMCTFAVVPKTNISKANLGK